MEFIMKIEDMTEDLVVEAEPPVPERKRVVIKAKKNYCDICKRSFDNSNDFKYHVAKGCRSFLKGKSDKPPMESHPCEMCPKHFVCKVTLEAHVQKKHPTRIKCQYCSGHYESSQEHQHKSILHKLDCTICSLTFLTDLHDTESVENVLCVKCTNRKRSAARVHQQSKRVIGGPRATISPIKTGNSYECPLCSDKFMSFLSYNVHSKPCLKLAEYIKKKDCLQKMALLTNQSNISESFNNGDESKEELHRALASANILVQQDVGKSESELVSILKHNNIRDLKRSPKLPSDSGDNPYSENKVEIQRKIKFDLDSSVDSKGDEHNIDSTDLENSEYTIVEVNNGSADTADTTTCEVEFSVESTTEEQAVTAYDRYETQTEELFQNMLIEKSSIVDNDQVEFVCTVCEAVIHTYKTYVKHVNEVHNLKGIFDIPKEYICQHCHVGKHTLSEMNKHIYMRHTTKLSCDHCTEKFLSEAHKFSHMKTEHRGLKTKFSCKYCSLKFSTLTLMKKHNTWHWFHEVIHCKGCEMDFAGRRQLKIHGCRHKIEGANDGNLCPECGKKMSSKSSLQSHIHFVHKEGDKETILCTDCGMLVKLRRYHRHRIRHNKNSFHCDICSRGFFAKDLLRQHMTTHVEGRPHECDECPAAFKQLRNLKVHQRNIHTEKTTFCKLCNIKFETSADYYSHRSTQHKRLPKPIPLESEDGFQCPLCPKILKTISAISNHCRIAHEPHLHVKCEVCFRVFPFARQLQNHMLTHSTNRPDLICVHCTKTFKTMGSLNSHIKWVHIGDRNFSCSYCNARFKRKDALISHERRHTNERPFRCNECGRGFRQPSDCKRHEAKHSSGLNYDKQRQRRRYSSNNAPTSVDNVMVIEEVVEQETEQEVEEEITTLEVPPQEDQQAADYLSFIVHQ